MINAGIPAQVEQQDLGTCLIPREVIKDMNVERLICLRVSGDSLSGDNIWDKMIAVVDTSPETINGKIYVIKTEDGFVARHLHKDNNSIILTSTNASYTKLEPNEVEIKGRVIASVGWNLH